MKLFYGNSFGYTIIQLLQLNALITSYENQIFFFINVLENKIFNVR